MVINELVEAVAKFCEETTANLMQPEPDRVVEARPGSLKRTEPVAEKNAVTYKHISVFKGCLPPKRKTDSDDYPFILVVPADGTVKSEKAVTTVQIYCGSWHEGTDGYAEVLNTVQRLLNAFTQIRDRLNHRYTLDSDIRWFFPDVSSQAGAPKMWQAMITTVWSYRAPSNNLPISNEYFKD